MPDSQGRHVASQTLKVTILHACLGILSIALLCLIAQTNPTLREIITGCALAGILFPLARFNAVTWVFPDLVVLPGIGLGILTNSLTSYFLVGDVASGLALSMTGAAMGSILSLSFIMLGFALFRKQMLGIGDVKCSTLLGAFLGPGLALSAAINGFLALCVLGPAIVVFLKRSDRHIQTGYFYIIGFEAALFLLRPVSNAFLLPTWVMR